VPCKFSKAYSYSEGLAATNESWSAYFKYIDKDGRECFGKEFPDATSFHDGYAFVGRLPVFP
jgi:hypothetical protein